MQGVLSSSTSHFGILIDFFAKGVQLLLFSLFLPSGVLSKNRAGLIDLDFRSKGRLVLFAKCKKSSHIYIFIV
jgi:hypothetical protein